MNQYYTERRLCWSYSLISVLLAVSVICTAVAYFHWKVTLDQCPGTWLENSSCGCIFFGVSTQQYFNGGHNSYCLYAVLAPLPVLVYAIIMALFHMYRVCINNVGQYEDEKATTMEEIEGESIVVSTRTRVSKKDDSVIYCWIPNCVAAALFCIYSSVHAAIVTDGFLQTCNQYRGHLVTILRSSGDDASLIHFRLACQAIFDYMDYIQKDAPNSRRGDYINTGLALQLAIISSWIAVVLWVVIAVFTGIRAYRERGLMTCCALSSGSIVSKSTYNNIVEDTF